MVPIYNEDERVDELVAWIERTMRDIGRNYEILMIDDGFTDRTVEKWKP